jgi:hypothetical protein
MCQLMKYLQPTVWLPAAFLYLYVLSIHPKGVFVSGNSTNVNSRSSPKGRRQPWDVALMYELSIRLGRHERLLPRRSVTLVK